MTGCKVKDVNSAAYTTTDGLIVSSVAHITTFSLVCESGKGEHLSLFASVPSAGKQVPVTRSLDGQTYEVSWVEEMSRSSSGDKAVKIYDEERYSLLRKAQRKAEEIGSSVESVEPLVTLIVNHRGTYRGPLIPAEVFAVAVILVIYYLAHSAKSKLVS